MRLIDDHEVVVAPVHVGQIDVARSAFVTREVGVIQNVIVESVGSQWVSPVVGFVESPVVSQSLGHEHEHTIVSQFVVFDDRQCFECLSQANTVRDDATAEAVEFVDRSDNSVSLELIELLPDHGVADTGGGFDDLLFVELVSPVLE